MSASPQQHLPQAGEKITPFARIPVSPGPIRHSAYVRRGAPTPSAQVGPAPEWPKMIYHATAAVEGRRCESEEEFLALGEDWSLEPVPVAAPAPQPVSGEAAAGSASMELIDRMYNRLCQECDILKADNQALQQANTTLQLETQKMRSQNASLQRRLFLLGQKMKKAGLDSTGTEAEGEDNVGTQSDEQTSDQSAS